MYDDTAGKSSAKNIHSVCADFGAGLVVGTASVGGTVHVPDNTLDAFTLAFGVAGSGNLSVTVTPIVGQVNPTQVVVTLSFTQVSP